MVIFYNAVLEKQACHISVESTVDKLYQMANIMLSNKQIIQCRESVNGKTYTLLIWKLELVLKLPINKRNKFFGETSKKTYKFSLYHTFW